VVTERKFSGFAAEITPANSSAVLASTDRLLTVRPQPGDRRPYFQGAAQQFLGVTFGHPFGWEQDLQYNANQATSSYNALQVRVDKRFSYGLQFLSHFTWSKALTHESYYFFINPRVGYGPSYYNRPKAFVFAGNYDLPFGKGKTFAGNSSPLVDRLIGGFALNGAFTWQAGLPWTPGYQSSSQDNDIIGFLNRSGSGGIDTSVGSFNPITHKVPFFTPSPTCCSLRDSQIQPSDRLLAHSLELLATSVAIRFLVLAISTPTCR
jgi:hypothetical protein